MVLSESAIGRRGLDSVRQLRAEYPNGSRRRAIAYLSAPSSKTRRTRDERTRKRPRRTSPGPAVRRGRVVGTTMTRIRRKRPDDCRKARTESGSWRAQLSRSRSHAVHPVHPAILSNAVSRTVEKPGEASRCSERQSADIATRGSTLVARRAGISVARTAIDRSPSSTEPKTRGSVALTP